MGHVRAEAAQVEYIRDLAVTDEQLNRLFAAAWPNHRRAAFENVHRASLTHICAVRQAQLVGYVNVAWDGRAHAFLLDPTVLPDSRHQGIGLRLVQAAIAAAKQAGVEWIHVDFEPTLREFYRRCGFQPTEAGLLRVVQ